MYVCTLSQQHARIHIYTHTHSDHTRSLLFYGHSSSSSLAGWILFDFLFDSIKLLVCVYPLPIWVLPLLLFLFHFSYYYFLNRKFRLSDAAQTSGPPSQCPFWCVCGSCWDMSTLLPTTLCTIFWGFVRNQNKLWEPLEDNPPDWAHVVVVSGYCCAKNKKKMFFLYQKVYRKMFHWVEFV